jgi:hypothetical protein
MFVAGENGINLCAAKRRSIRPHHNAANREPSVVGRYGLWWLLGFQCRCEHSRRGVFRSAVSHLLIGGWGTCACQTQVADRQYR